MHIGLVGLGKMGGNMRSRLRDKGIEVTGYDPNPDVTDVPSLAALVEALPSPKIVWVMVPSGKVTRDTVENLAPLLKDGDLVIDGGNSKWTDDEINAKVLGERGTGYMDCGVSGGVWGKDNGYGLMCGGTKAQVELALPIFDALRPDGPREEGLMHAYAEGYELLEAKGIIHDVPAVFKAWTRGTVVRSWLLDLMVRALEEDPKLDNIRGYAQDSGEGRWTLEQAIENAVPMPVLAAALFARFASRQEDSPSIKAVAALRNQFGGHAVTQAGPSSGTGSVND
jgi:6-phosphogluconate dehydrogenase